MKLITLTNEFSAKIMVEKFFFFLIFEKTSALSYIVRVL